MGFRRRHQANQHTEDYPDDYDDYDYDDSHAHTANAEDYDEEATEVDPWQEDEYGQMAYYAEGDGEEEAEEKQETDISDGEIAREVMCTFVANVGPVDLDDGESLEALALVCQDEQQAYFARKQTRKRFKGKGKGTGKGKGPQDGCFVCGGPH